MISKHKDLILALIFDAIGLATFLLPGVGEWLDVIWAPITYFLSMRMFGSKGFAAMTALEEILPFTDFIPSFLIGWIWKYYWRK